MHTILTTEKASIKYIYLPLYGVFEVDENNKYYKNAYPTKQDAELHGLVEHIGKVQKENSNYKRLILDNEKIIKYNESVISSLSEKVDNILKNNPEYLL